MTVSNSTKNTYYTPKLFAMGATFSTLLAARDIKNYVNLKPNLKNTSFSTKHQFLSGVLANLDVQNFAKLKKSTISKLMKVTRKNVFRNFATKIAVLTLLCTAAGISRDLKERNKLPKIFVD